MKLLFLVLASLSMSACLDKVKHDVSVDVTDSGTISVSHHGNRAGVSLITLEDGTKCAVMIGYQHSGISCGWND